MTICMIGFFICLFLAFFTAPILGASFGIMAVIFLCTRILIENIDSLFKKYFDKASKEKNK